MNYGLLSFLLVLGLFSCKENSSLVEQKADTFIYSDAAGLAAVKQRIAANDPYYTSAYEKLLARANEALNMDTNPVTNKETAAPSGDKHDYLSIGPYWWPNPETEDGLPWIRRDGEVNPLTRGNDTDRERLRELFDALGTLSFAFYYSKEPKYAQRAMELMRVWFVEEATKVNPNANFGQGIPGITTGRSFGIIEWIGVNKIVNALQLLEHADLLEENFKKEMQKWLSDYLDWLLTSKLGKEEGSRPNNHANWYDYQVLGISIYLGKTETAKKRAESIKTKRIAAQIEPDGSQPHEIARTKSLSYSIMNLKAMVFNAQLAKQVGVDVLNYKTVDGRNLLQAAQFLMPYAQKEKVWTHQQISEGGWGKVVEDRLLPLFSVMSSIYQNPLLEDLEAMKQSLSSLERLQYPPLLYEH